MSKAGAAHDRSVATVSGLEFRKWAEYGTEAYGRTPWFFLRELAQNSRDADARSVRVEASRDGEGREVLTFADDGSGMSLAHARKYLFRLYSSSKERDDLAAGFYGVGFWTVLFFDPMSIRVESRTKGEGWAMAMDRELHVDACPCELALPGTRVTLVRRPIFPDVGQFAAQVRQELIHYCGFLRRKSRRPRVLPVHFAGVRINQPFSLPGPLSLEFRKGSMEGVVGVGASPRVYLYAKGLPIWEGSFLEELLHARDHDFKMEVEEGIYPVFLLNGNDLQVNLFRREAIDDAALRRLIQVGRSQLKQWIALCSRHVRKRSPWMHIKESARSMRRVFSVKPRPLPLLISFLLVAFMGFIVWAISQRIPARGAFSTLQVDRAMELGTVANEKNRGQGFRLDYTPGDDLLLKLFHADGFDERRGFNFLQENNESAPSIAPCQGKIYRFFLETEKTDFIYLPRPSGYRIDPLSIAGERPWRRPHYFTLLQEGNRLALPSKEKWRISYQACPDDVKLISQASLERLTKVPSSAAPVLDRLLGIDDLDTLAIEDKIGAVTVLCRRLFFYDISPETVERYRRGASLDWISRVLQIGRGDCDVLNGFAILLLRRLHVPCRLAVGYSGEKGSVKPPMHAWAEYYSLGWKTLDVTTACSPAPGGVNMPGNEEARANDRSTTRAGMGFFHLLVGLSILAFVTGAGAGWRMKRQKQKEKWIRFDLEPDAMHREMGGIALGMIRNPDFWGWDKRLWDEPFLPLQNRSWLSLRDALSLARKDRLYVGNKRNPYTSAMLAKGDCVLVAEDEAFQPLFRVFPQLINLDRLESLMARWPEELPDSPARRLLEEANRTIQRVSGALPLILSAEGLRDRQWERISLGARRRRVCKGVCSDFAAINPQSPLLAELADLHAANPELAQFRLIRRLCLDDGNDANGSILSTLAEFLMQNRGKHG